MKSFISMLIFLGVFTLNNYSAHAQTPNWLWAQQAGGTDVNEGLGIATDGPGNSIVTGFFFGTATFGDTTLSSAGSADIFIAKLASGVTGIAEEFALPRSFNLSQNYPNPFNPKTQIEYSLPKSSDVIITVYDALGRKAQTLVNKFQTAGSHSVSFDGRGLSSGIFFYRLEAGNFVETKKMLLMK